MKFGDTLYQRSVPKWASYNLNYNEIKRLIKIRTTTGTATPISIPGSSNNKWKDLEDDLFQILSDQHDNITLFLNSKSGEIDRRLVHLEKQLKGAQRSVEHPNSHPVLQTRRYHKLSQEAEVIGEDIQALSRFTSVQKTAFRKLLKKYRKWTNSTGLQSRLETEVFANGQLNQNYAKQLERLSVQKKLLIEELQGPMLQAEYPARRSETSNFVQASSDSGVTQINEALEQGSAQFDAALLMVPFGASAGTASYWVHPDNLLEAQVLLLRHVQEVKNSASPPRKGSSDSIDSQASSLNSHISSLGNTHVVYYDNPQRFAQDVTTSRSSKVALSAHWGHDADAAVTLSDLTHLGSGGEAISIKRKDLVKTLTGSRTLTTTNNGPSTMVTNIQRVQSYLLEHRDVKPLAEMHSNRTRYRAISRSSSVGTWATLDTDIIVSPFNAEDLGSTHVDADSGQTFPYAVLEIRWEFCRVPEIVRTLDSSHLAEKVRGFSLESAAIHSIRDELEQPLWKPLLEKDIRRIPITARVSAAGRRQASTQPFHDTVAGSASGTSSADGFADSVFSTPPGQSSSASETGTRISTRDTPVNRKPRSAINGRMKKKKRARINAESPPPKPERYWNEFDDGDSDVNQEETYAIYVDPNEKFPGTEAVSKAFGVVYNSMNKVKSSLASRLSLRSKNEDRRPDERTALLITTDLDHESSDSDSTPVSSSLNSPTLYGVSSQKSSYFKSAARSQYRPRQRLTLRQRRLETTYFSFYTGLLALGYILLFISAILLNTGRKKERLEVDAGVMTGIISSEVCALASLALICMRKTKLSTVHWGTVIIASVGVIGIGIVLFFIAACQATNLSEMPPIL